MPRAKPRTADGPACAGPAPLRPRYRHETGVDEAGAAAADATRAAGPPDGRPRLTSPLSVIAPHAPVAGRLGLGTLPLSGIYGPVDDREALRVVGQALDHGVALIDAADPTPAARGHRLVGRAIAARRHEVFLAAHACRARTGTPQEAAELCDTTLRSLAVDYLDLYYLADAGREIPIEDRIGALTPLVDAGKVRHLGIRGLARDDLARAHATHPIAAVAVEYSLLARRAEDAQLSAARRLGIDVVAIRPLGRGLLTGSPSVPGRADPRRRDPAFTGAARRAGPVLERVRGLAAELDVSTSRLALAWLLSRGDDVIPVPGTRSAVHLEMNLLSVDVILTAEAAARLD